MTTETVTVRNPVGLHARPAADLVRAVRSSGLRVTVAANAKRADAGSILSVLGLGVRQGDEVLLEADGGTPATEKSLIQTLRHLLEREEG